MVPPHAPHLFENRYRISSTRLPNWDYGHDGAYFVTICTHNRQRFLGSLEQNGVAPNRAGTIVQAAIDQIPSQFPWAMIDAAVVMPDHLHLVLRIEKCVEDLANEVPQVRRQVGEPLRGCHNPMRRQDLARVVRWLKGRCTFEIRQFEPGFAWQAGYHDRLIRDESSHTAHCGYVWSNPERAWRKHLGKGD